MPIKAIETTYKGYRMRSRTEARWAVFFDSLGIKWEYEPEGFELARGRYLPDFALYHPKTKQRYWVEIKGTTPTASEIAKFDELVFGTGCLGGSIYVGLPYFDWPISDDTVEYSWYFGESSGFFQEESNSFDSFHSILDDFSELYYFSDEGVLKYKGQSSPFSVAIETALSHRFGERGQS